MIIGKTNKICQIWQEHFFYLSPLDNDSCKDENYTSTANRTESVFGDSSSDLYTPTQSNMGIMQQTANGSMARHNIPIDNMATPIQSIECHTAESECDYAQAQCK